MSDVSHLRVLLRQAAESGLHVHTSVYELVELMERNRYVHDQMLRVSAHLTWRKDVLIELMRGASYSVSGAWGAATAVEFEVLAAAEKYCRPVVSATDING